ncbi:hypothetical protein ACFVGY_11990 [Streptomyces sp. NPDC127106]|uniref:hypothetical protein n=1 Tax=Streptomyces sp. NPDC127106 TaxID=3345360 RepID=UPI003628310B
MADVFLRIMLICAVLGVFGAAWRSSGVGGLCHRDALELRRQQRFRDVLSLNTHAVWLAHQEAAAAAESVPELTRRAPCAACGASSRVVGWGEP